MGCDVSRLHETLGTYTKIAPTCEPFIKFGVHTSKVQQKQFIINKVLLENSFSTYKIRKTKNYFFKTNCCNY